MKVYVVVDEDGDVVFDGTHDECELYILQHAPEVLTICETNETTEI